MITMNQNLKSTLCASMVSLPCIGVASPKVECFNNIERPNFLVIVCEDISPYLGCYGDSVAVTPNLDRFSTQAVRHTNMFTCVGVSSPSRYSLITGRYSSTDGANYMRVTEFNPDFSVVPPEGVKCYTELMRREGYFCTNNSKTDYQFTAPVAAWDENGNQAHWKHAPKDQPFLAIFNLGITHESQIWKNTDKPLAVQPQSINLPPYYPDTEIVRHDHAVLYSNIKKMDEQFQKLLQELEQSDRFENTIVIFYSDNGGPLPRGKREIMDSGTKVPFMIRFPNCEGQGGKCDNLNMFVDIPATILSLAGIEPPKNIHGQPFYGKYASNKTRRFVFGATDRFDEQVEKRASVRNERYLYIRNYMPQQSIYRPNKYRLSMPMMREMLSMFEAGQLNQVQSRWFESPAYEEELYDCVEDPFQIHNLVGERQYDTLLSKMRRAYQKKWIEAYNKEWVSQPEEFFVQRMWPDGVKPTCEQPIVRKEQERLIVENDLNVYSVSYRDAQERHWNIYTEPIPLKEGQNVVIRVERIGYIATEVCL